MRRVTFEQLREGLLMRFGGRVWRVGFLRQIRLQDGTYAVDDPEEVTNVDTQTPADKQAF